MAREMTKRRCNLAIKFDRLKYHSILAQLAPTLFMEDLVAEFARDDGLCVPETWSQLGSEEIRALQSKSYTEVAHLTSDRARVEEYILQHARLTRCSVQSFASEGVTS